ncbi:MAG: 3-oxoacyl-ACP reductase FabG [Nitrospirota bacterium]|jgi:3-oxoacyl-[acyl-carrier protein] reductase
MNRLTGKTALVTGASRGIGRAVALALAGEGAGVAVNYRAREQEALKTCEEIRKLGSRAAAVQADVSISADVSRMVETVQKELGPADVLVNNAGTAGRQPIDDIAESDWDEVLAVNLTSAFLVTRAVLPGMRARGWGRIINISSVAAQIGGVVGPHYAASKAGVIGLAHYYASHFAKEGVTVNAIAPGPVSTEMVAALRHLTPDTVPVGRFGAAEEIAAVAVMLACNGYITGQTINVNGGRYFS